MLNNWKYKLIITNKDNEQITIETPIRMECTISMGINQSSATANFVLYNLSATHRAQIRYSPALLCQNIKTFTDVMSDIELYVAKDGQSYVRMFKGALIEAYSQESGAQPGIATYITAYNIPIWMTMSSHIFAKGTSKREAIKAIAKDIPGVNLDNLGSIEGNFLTDTTCDGNALEQIQKICGGNAFVENDSLSVIPTNECIQGFLSEITDDAVILGTPIIKQAYLTFKCLFIPELKFQQNLKVKSKVYPDFNNNYRVVGYTHTLVFSETEGGNKTTDVHCLYCDEAAYQDVITTMGVVKDGDDYKTAISTQSNNLVNGETVTPLSDTEQGDIIRVWNYLQTHNGEIPNWKVTADISWSAMIGHNNKPSERKSELSKDILANCVVMAKKLQRFKDVNRLGALTISSGWRSRKNNTNCGGAGGSLHLYGRAIDFKVGNTRSIYYSLIHGKWDGGYGLSPKWGHIHIDNGRRCNVYNN